MKRITFFVYLFSIATLYVAAQPALTIDSTELNQKDATNQKQGFWQEKTGTLVTRGNYTDDKKDGVWLTYHGKGFIQKIEEYKNGIKDGVMVSIDQRGYLQSELYYKNGKLHGIATKYTYGGRPMSIITYNNGQIDGLSKKFYDHNSNPQEETYYKNGIRHGISKWYNTDGALIAEYFYDNGKFEGIQKTFYISGKLLTEEVYEANIPIEYREFHENGNLKLAGEYQDGLKNGKWIEYDDTGKELSKTTYKNGEEK